MTGRPPSRSASLTGHHSRNTSRTGIVMASHVNAGRSQSPRPPGPGSAVPGAPPSRGVERKPSISSYPHAHNRQASIVNGGIQHSRNPSFVNSPTTSPLSPNNMGTVRGAGEQITIPDLPLSPTGTLVPSDISALSSQLSTMSTINAMANSGDQSRAPSAMDTMRTITPHGRPSTSRREGHSHSHSYSHHSSEPKTPAEYALHILFTQFVRLAEAKIDQCMKCGLEVEPNVEAICGAGVDPAFDKLIGSLGYIARHKPRPVIDSVMYWRKGKSEAANSARTELKHQMHHTKPTSPPSSNTKLQDGFSALMRRNTENVPPDIGTPLTSPGHSHNNSISTPQAQASIAADRKSTIAIYILCRVLIEVIGQTTLESMSKEMAFKLENIVFQQLRLADPDVLVASPLRMSNWTLFAQLLGVMSELHFDSVSDLFISSLEDSGKGFVSRESEPRIELVIKGMSYLKIKLYPPDAFEQGSELMYLITKLFLSSQVQRIKHAYCDLYMKLLLPVAAAGDSEFNMPRWIDFIQQVYPRLSEMLMKARHWPAVFPVLGTVLCIMPRESFNATWLPLLEANFPKLKDRSVRTMLLQTTARLLWVYIFRCSETLNTTVKKLEVVIRALFLPGRKSFLIGADADLMAVYVQLIRFIGSKHQDFCFRNVLTPLLNADVMLSHRHTDLTLECLTSERMIVGIKAFLEIMNDLEKQDSTPPFPVKFETGHEEQAPPISTWLAKFVEERSEAMKRLDRMSRPVQLDRLGAVAREYFDKFGKILGQIILVCDSNFGGKALLDEKFNPPPPKTPVAASFSFNLDHPPVDQKQIYFELLCVALAALPRCLPPESLINFNKIVEILCHGTAHSDQRVATASANALKCIARQSLQRQKVIIGFARFIFDFDTKYATTADGGLLGPAHIENTLKLYVELLQIWIDAIKQKTKAPATPSLLSMNMNMNMNMNMQPPEPEQIKPDDLEISNVLAIVDEIESHGLFFLSSQSRIVRKFAIMVLKLITEFDCALDEEEHGSASLALRKSRRESQRFTRIIQIMEYDSLHIMNQNVNDEKWSVADRSRLRRELMENSAQDALVKLATSENQYDSSLWFKLFPKLIRVCFERFPLTVVQCRDSVCARLNHMHSQIQFASETPRFQTRLASPSAADISIEQWKLYLIVACSTLTLTDEQVARQPTPNLQHARKTSKSASNASQNPYDRLNSGRSLFQLVVPFINSENQAIREAVIFGLGSINLNLYKTLVETLQPIIMRWNDGPGAKVQRPGQNGQMVVRRSTRHDRWRTGITHIMQLTSYFLLQPDVYNDDWMLRHIINLIKDNKNFLSDPDVKGDIAYHRLRRYFCGLTEDFYEGILKLPDQEHEKWLPFDGRLSLFSLIEDWCGTNSAWRQHINAAVEIEKNDLKNAALSAMASLCAGPVMKIIENKSTLTFDILGIFHWLESIFGESSDRIHRIGRKALKNLLECNKKVPSILALAIRQCYLYKNSPKGIESYFHVVSEVLINSTDDPCDHWKSLALALFKIGDDNQKIRSKAATLLRITEQRFFGSQTTLDYEVSISDKTAAVFKKAQFELSRTLSQQHPEAAFFIFSEFTLFFNIVDGKGQRDILAVLLPWVQMIELQQDPNGGPSPSSYMVLANLFEITVKFSGKIHNEIEGLWKALASAPYAGNVKVVLDFIIAQSLERKEQNFVNVGKQIIVFLAGTANGSKLVEALLEYLQPRLMTSPQKNQEPQGVPDASLFPYMANLAESLPVGGKQHGFSRGHLGLIFMVDLMVGPVPEMSPNLPLLLQVVFVLWDHYVPLVQEQAREMLVHLIHELVISKTGKSIEELHRVREFVEAVRTQQAKMQWAYDETGSDTDPHRVAPSMGQMIEDVLDFFTPDHKLLKVQWSRVALQWATNCPVRHLACRSFQVFRCLLDAADLDQPMLGDMLARLSNTIADNSPDIQSFAMEILITLNAILAALDPEDLMHFPQMFWATVACLHTIHENEFMEVLSLLEKHLLKIDLSMEDNVNILVSMFPSNWDGNFEGLQALMVKGLRSGVALPKTLQVMDKLNKFPSNKLVGGDDRLLIALLSNLPRFLDASEKEAVPDEILACAASLKQIADDESQPDIARIMGAYAAGRFRNKDGFKSQAVSAIRNAYFPDYEGPALIFLVGLLTNATPWVKHKVMELLNSLLPIIDLKKPEFTGLGADLISPLLRLLQTEYCQQALEVLDKVISISGGKMDRQVMRMSMGNRTIKKEYERTETLFGIPEDSGWAIPSPAIKAQTTRHNVHSVFYTCQIPETPQDPLGDAPDMQFIMEDYGYTSFQDRTATMLSEGVGGEGGLGDMVVRLESLDNFFADESFNSTQTQTTDGDAAETASQTYDNRVYHILNRSLQRSPSVTSFNHTFGDSLSMPPGFVREHPPIMTPTLFAAPPMTPAAFGKGGVPNRVTGNQQLGYEDMRRHPGGSESSSDNEYEEDVSDDDLEDHATATTPKDDSPFLLESLLRSAGQKAKSGVEGVRNLRRGREERKEEREREKEMKAAEKEKRVVSPRGFGKLPKSPKLGARRGGDRTSPPPPMPPAENLTGW
ncbi:Cell morphoproteinsis protein PAG1 [Orbilia oligospora]|nr:Cell morphoproteinsis protein PAG1 [Orbilia oligospora]